MKRFAINLMLGASILASPVLVGCDKTISEEKSVQEKSDGTTVKKEEKVVEKPDGSIEKTTEKKVDQR